MTVPDVAFTYTYFMPICMVIAAVSCVVFIVSRVNAKRGDGAWDNKLLVTHTVILVCFLLTTTTAFSSSVRAQSDIRRAVLDQYGVTLHNNALTAQAPVKPGDGATLRAKGPALESLTCQLTVTQARTLHVTCQGPQGVTYPHAGTPN